MKVNTMLVLVCCIAAVAPVFGETETGAEAVDLRSLLSADTSFALIIDDAPSFIANWQESPLARLWEDPQVTRFFAPLRTEIGIDEWNDKVREETGYELDELLAMFEGPAVLFGHDLGADIMQDVEAEEVGEVDEDDQSVPIVFMAEVGESGEQLRELLLRKAEEVEQEGGAEATRTVVEEFRGIDLYFERNPASDDEEEPNAVAAWSVINEVFVMTVDAELLEGLVADVLDGGVEQTLASTASFQSVTRYIEQGDALLYVNLEQLVPVFEELFALGYDVAAARDGVVEGEEEAAPAQPQIPASKILDALSLDVLQAFFVSLDLDAGGAALDAGVTYNDNTGLLKLLAYGPSAASMPAWVPEDAVSFGSGSFDFQAAWAAVEEILNSIEPAFLMMAAAQASAVIQGAGVELDLRRDVLENLGAELVMVEVEPAATVPDEQEEPVLPVQSQVIALRVKQRQGIELALETVKNMMGQGSELFTGREYLDTTIYTVNDAVASAGNEFAYAITDEYLLLNIGTSEALEAVLIGMNKPRPSAWKRSDVKEALAVLPEGAVAVGFQDMAKTGSKIFDLIALMSLMDEATEMGDPGAVPDEDVFGKYFGPMVSGFYKDNNSMLLRLRLMPPAGGAAAR